MKYEIPPSVFDEPALLQKKPQFHWNPFYHLWTGMQHVAYFFAPPNGCVYCWVWRMFFIGVACGYALGYWKWGM